MMNENLLDVIHQNKAVLIGLVVILLVCVVLLVWKVLASPSSEAESFGSTAAPREPLPENISWKNDPVMWDFQNGTLGWHSELGTTACGGSFYAAAVKMEDLAEQEGTIWVSQYSGTDPLPAVGGAWGSFKLKDDSWAVAANAISGWSAEKSAEENGWKFVLVEPAGTAPEGTTGYVENGTWREWFGVNLDTLGLGEQTATVSEFAFAGYPTEWLRKDPEAISRFWNVDVTDPFFDTYGLHAVYRLDRASEDESIKDHIDCKVVGVDAFELPDGIVRTEDELTGGEFVSPSEAAASSSWGDPESFR